MLFPWWFAWSLFDYEFDPWVSWLMVGAQFLLSSVNATTTQQQRLMIVLYHFLWRYVSLCGRRMRNSKCLLCWAHCAAFRLSVLIVRRRMMPSKFVLLLIWRSKVCHINMSFASVARCVACVTCLRLVVRVCGYGFACVWVCVCVNDAS